MYHLPGTTPEARSVEEAFGGRPIADTLHFGAVGTPASPTRISIAPRERKVDFVMLGCPHNSIEQVWLIASLLEGRRAYPRYRALGTHAAGLA